jgi:taurine dioxygenase
MPYKGEAGQMNIDTIGPRRKIRDTREYLQAQSFSQFDVQPLSPSIGAELSGIDLGQPMSEETFREVHHALLAYKVIFFRDQQITTAQHVEFSRKFGELEVHPFLPSNTDFAELVRFQKDGEEVGVENLWHSDVSWRQTPSLGSVLRAIETPAVGGDTLFCDMVAAYAGLSDELKEKIEGRTAVHDFTHTFGMALDAETLAQKKLEYPPAHHPIVRTHPQTGEKILYVNAFFTAYIEDMEPAESDELLKTLYSQANYPEYQCRFQWRDNSIAFWDNRSTQHYATSDYWPQKRTMERATIIGERPV